MNRCWKAEEIAPPSPPPCGEEDAPVPPADEEAVADGGGRWREVGERGDTEWQVVGGGLLLVVGLCPSLGLPNSSSGRLLQPRAEVEAADEEGVVAAVVERDDILY
jgi:hypothetical protein